MSSPTCLGEQFETILLSAQQGEAWALGRLYELLQPSVLTYLRAQDREAEDIAADAWVDVARGIAGFDGGEGGFRRFVFSIARRRLIDVRRARGRRKTNPASHDRLETASPDTTADRLERDDATRRIVALLPEAQAQVVLLRVVGGFTVDEVAAMLGKRAGAVRALQHRALRQLAKKVPSPRNADVLPDDVDV